MKRAFTSSLLSIVVVWLAFFAWSRSASVPTPAVKPAAIDYSFDASALNRSNENRLTSYADMLDKVTPGVVGVYPSTKTNPDLLQLSAAGRGGNGRGGRGTGGNGPTATPPAGSGSGSGPGATTPNGTGGRGGRGRRGGGGIALLPPNKPDWSGPDSIDYWYLGVGSGCIISADGYILTNHHVVTDSQYAVDAILVKLPDGREFAATVIGSDEATDLALLKINAKNLPTIKLADSDKLHVGDIVFAIGNPMDVGLTVTHGIVSAMGRQVNSSDDPSQSKVHFENFIQTDASINEGNSGGPLVDAEGRLVGLNSEILSASRTGGSIGIGFAVPSNLARHVADDLINGNTVHRGVLGVGTKDIDHNLAQAMGMANTHGAIVTTIDERSPAAKSDLKRYDVVLKVNDSEVDSTGKLRYLLALADPGTAANLTILRDGKPRNVKVVLADRSVLYNDTGESAQTPASTVAAPTVPLRNNGELLTGVTLTPLTDELHSSSGPDSIPDDVQGLIVTQVQNASPYYNLFRSGAVIMEVNKKPITTVDELKANLKSGALNMFYIYLPTFNTQVAGRPFSIPAHTDLVTEVVPESKSQN